MILAAALAGAACVLPAGWHAVDAKAPHVVVVGELHGTVEGPAVFGDIACALVKRGERVLVAVEQNAADDRALQAAWRLPPRAFAAALPEALRWRGRHDGMASTAMRDLLVRLHALKAGRGAVAVTAFSGDRDEAQARRFAHLVGQGRNEAIKADNLSDAAARGRYDRVLVLVGNLHAMTRPVGEGAGAFEPMAMRLPRDRLVSLVLTNGAGTAWNCVEAPATPDRPDCGAHPVGAMTGFEQASPPRVAMGAPAALPAGFPFDGHLWIRPVRASPPALP